MLKIAARNLWRRKSRSVLAVLALVIGILAIVLLVSLTAGLKASYSELLGGIGGLYVIEKGAQDNTLSKLEMSYADELEQIPGVRAVLPEVMTIVNDIDGEPPSGGSLMFGMVAAMGLDPEREMRRVGMPYGVALLRGRMMQPGDSAVIVLGNKIAEDLKKGIGSTIEVNGKKFKVIGTFSKSEMTDSFVAMTIDDARELAGLGKEYAQDFVVQLTDPQNEERVAQTIRFKWPDDLDVFTASDMSQMMDTIMGVIDQFFWIIAAIALAIAGVGIVNTMLIAVNERTTEFGVLRAMGWTQRDVLQLVVTESILLGISGGVIGVASGYAITWWLGTVLPFAPALTPQLALIAFAFALAAGLFGGAYPAWKASKMDPIKAIRGER